MAIITTRFRKNNIQRVFDELTSPSTYGTLLTYNSTAAFTNTYFLAGPAAVSGNGTTQLVFLRNFKIESGMSLYFADTILAISGASVNVVAIDNSQTATVNIAGTSTPSTPITVITISTAGNNTNPVSTVGSPVTTTGNQIAFVSNYYIGIGKSDPWTDEANPPAPTSAIREVREVRSNLQALKKIICAYNPAGSLNTFNILGVSPHQTGDVGYVIPRITYISNSKYQQWDPSDLTTLYPISTALPCYVIDSSKIFICVIQGSGISTTPSLNSYVTTNSIAKYATFVPGTDGYTWCYVADLIAGQLDNSQFVQIYRTRNSGASTTAGKIYGFKIVSSGSGYSTSSTLTVLGDGPANSGVATSGTISSVSTTGGITSISLSNTGSLYTNATVSVSGGSGAVIIPLLAPQNGFGYDLINDLPCWFAGITVSFVADESGDAPIVDTYRQLSVIRNPVIGYDSLDSTNTSPTFVYRAPKFFIVNGTSSPGLTQGAVLSQVQGSSSAKAYYDYYAADSGASVTRIYYHQNNTSGVNFLPFTGVTNITSGVVTLTPYTGGSGYGGSAYGNSAYQPNSGEIIFVDNRIPITRASGNTENLTAVIQF